MNNEPVPAFQDTPDLRKEIIHACHYLLDLKFFIGTWGNIAVRVEEGLIVTPSAVDYKTMQPEDLVVVSWDGHKIKGERLPSSEMHLHRLLLLKRQDMGASVHTHSPYISAVSCTRKTLPVFIEDVAQIIGGEVRCSRYTPAGRHLDLAKAASEAMGEDSAAVLLANHGAVTCGRTLKEAVTAAEVLEKAAKCYIYANSIGGCRNIPEDMVKEERHRYLYKYGREQDAAEG